MNNDRRLDGAQYAPVSNDQRHDDAQYAPVDNDQRHDAQYAPVNNDRRLQRLPPCALSREHHFHNEDDDESRSRTCHDGTVLECSLTSDFAGSDVPGFGLRAFGVLCRHVAYETHGTASSLIARNFPDAVIRGDVGLRGSDDHSRCDIITAGFPCQPFSPLGLGLGRNETGGRGCLVDHTVLEICARMPSVFFPENVAAFAASDNGASDNGAARQKLLKYRSLDDAN